MKMKLAIVSSALVGIVFGVLGEFSILKGSWLSIAVWIAVGILIGAFIEDRRCVARAGLSYGFFLSSSYFISGFAGGDIILFGILSIVLSLVGALCGWCLAYAGNRVKDGLRGRKAA